MEALANPDCGWFFQVDSKEFASIPGSPIAYWASEAMLYAFRTGIPFGELGRPSAGITTGDNATFIHYWWEVAIDRIAFNVQSMNERPDWARWFPCNKGGEYRKWYGNRENIMAFDDIAIASMTELPGYRPVNLDLQFARSVSWSDITSGINSFRANGSCSLFDHVGISAFPDSSNFNVILGFLNSSVCHSLLRVLAPTLHCNAGDVAKHPIAKDIDSDFAEEFVDSCLALSREDWDVFEISWSFGRHPLA